MSEELLGNLRSQIDAVDQKLLSLVLSRLDLVDKISEVKRTNKLPVFVPGREDEILERIVSQVDPKYSVYVRELFTNILDVSKRYQIDKEWRSA